MRAFLVSVVTIVDDLQNFVSAITRAEGIFNVKISKILKRKQEASSSTYEERISNEPQYKSNCLVWLSVAHVAHSHRNKKNKNF